MGMARAVHGNGQAQCVEVAARGL